MYFVMSLLPSQDTSFYGLENRRQIIPALFHAVMECICKCCKFTTSREDDANNQHDDLESSACNISSSKPAQKNHRDVRVKDRWNQFEAWRGKNGLEPLQVRSFEGATGIIGFRTETANETDTLVHFVDDNGSPTRVPMTENPSRETALEHKAQEAVKNINLSEIVAFIKHEHRKVQRAEAKKKVFKHAIIVLSKIMHNNGNLFYCLYLHRRMIQITISFRQGTTLLGASRLPSTFTRSAYPGISGFETRWSFL